MFSSYSHFLIYVPNFSIAFFVLNIISFSSVVFNDSFHPKKSLEGCKKVCSSLIFLNKQNKIRNIKI